LLSVRDGRLVTPGGASYRVLYLPPYVTRVTLPVLRKLRELVRAGAIVVGKRPLGGLGIESPDSEVKALADEIWSSPGVYGDGNLRAALDSQSIEPDVTVSPSAAPASVHRENDKADIYFLSNPHGQAVNICPLFRVSGKRAELWHAEDGHVEAVSYEQTPQGTRVCLHLQKDAAEFIVFRGDAATQRWRAPIVTTRVLMQQMEGPWSLKFESGRGAPAVAIFDHLMDWSVSNDPGIRYFSGAATYSRRLTVPSAWIQSRRRVVLDLGDVRDVAVVSIDGKVVATTWHAPFEADLTPELTPGSHELEIKVVNLWVNRLIGDKQPGATPVAFAPQSPYTADSILRPSGLLGPVRILARDTQ